MYLETDKDHKALLQGYNQGSLSSIKPQSIQSQAIAGII